MRGIDACRWVAEGWRIVDGRWHAFVATTPTAPDCSKTAVLAEQVWANSWIMRTTKT